MAATATRIAAAGLDGIVGCRVDAGRRAVMPMIVMAVVFRDYTVFVLAVCADRAPGKL